MKLINILIFIIVFINIIKSSTTDEEDENEFSHVLKLTDSNFEDITTSNPNDIVMVEFYAPWCGHCQHLKPIYNQFADKLASKKEIKISKIDCVANPKQCKRFSIRSYPTIKVINNGIVYDMKGEKTMETLMDFIKGGYLKEETSRKALPPSSIIKIVDLTTETFPSPNDGNWLIYFHIPRCIYCEKFMPEFDSLSKADFSDSKETFNFGKVNCEENAEICDLYRVDYYPNIKYFENGTNEYRNYNHEPTTANLREFVMFYNKHVSPIKRPWNPIFALFEEAIKEFVWLFLFVSFVFGFFISYVFFGMNSNSSINNSKQQIQSKIKKSQ